MATPLFDEDLKQLKKWRILLELYPCWLEEFAYLCNEVSRSDRHLEPLELNAARNHVVISKFKWKQKQVQWKIENALLGEYAFSLNTGWVL